MYKAICCSLLAATGCVTVRDGAAPFFGRAPAQSSPCEVRVLRSPRKVSLRKSEAS